MAAPPEVGSFCGWRIPTLKRCRPEYDALIQEDLLWLGLAWDGPDPAAGRAHTLLQLMPRTAWFKRTSLPLLLHPL